LGRGTIGDGELVALEVWLAILEVVAVLDETVDVEVPGDPEVEEVEDLCCVPPTTPPTTAATTTHRSIIPITMTRFLRQKLLLVGSVAAATSPTLFVAFTPTTSFSLGRTTSLSTDCVATGFLDILEWPVSRS
jgi:hypothetical protein